MRRSKSVQVARLGFRHPILWAFAGIMAIVAVVIYVVFLGLEMWMWAWWQKRGQRAEAAATAEPVSTYGRPLMKRA